MIESTLLLEEQVTQQAADCCKTVEDKGMRYFAAVHPSRQVPDDWGEPVWLNEMMCCYLVDYTDTETEVVYDNTTEPERDRLQYDLKDVVEDDSGEKHNYQVIQHPFL